MTDLSASSSLPVDVLVVEDDIQLRGLVERILLRAGHRVLLAGDGATAFAMLAEHGDSLSAAYLDLTLPDMRGERVLERLRERHPTMRVVLTSGEDPPATPLPLDAVTTFLAKPFLVRELCDAFSLRRADVPPAG